MGRAHRRRLPAFSAAISMRRIGLLEPPEARNREKLR